MFKGTFITEWDEGARICDQIFFSKQSVDYFVSQLTAVTVHSRIDGWLINIENPIVESMVENIIYFLHCLKISLNTLGNNSTIIWYDSVTLEGKLDWQNELNVKNRYGMKIGLKPFFFLSPTSDVITKFKFRNFFDACDGIFLNYTWTAQHLSRSVIEAGERSLDVYVGKH